jgi:hypothetical protein
MRLIPEKSRFRQLHRSLPTSLVEIKPNRYLSSMARLRQKHLTYYGVTLVSIALLYIAAIMFHAWQVRNRATRLLAYVRELHPGLTTETQARLRLATLSRYETDFGDNRRGQKIEEVNYEFSNVADWTARALRPLPTSWATGLTLPWTRFAVTIAYRDGVVSELHIVEMQEDIPGMLHPNSASTTIFSSRLGQQLGFIPQPSPGFTGYSSESRSAGQVGTNGELTSFSCCHERWITLDERATPKQLADSLNFQLHCLTSWRRCKDDRYILP